MPCIGSLNTCPMGIGSDHQHTKPMQKEMLLFPLQSDSSTGHDQLSEPVLTILDGSTGGSGLIRIE